MDYTREQLLEAADILDAAHDVLLRDGWASVLLQDDPGTRRCMESAVAVAIGWKADTFFSFMREPTAVPEVVQLIRRRGVDFYFNDVRDRTEDEVFDKLRSVAKQLREEAS